MPVKICPGRGINDLFKAQMIQGHKYNFSVIQAKQRGDEANKSLKRLKVLSSIAKI